MGLKDRGASKVLVNQFSGVTASTCEVIENTCDLDKRLHLKKGLEQSYRQQGPVFHQTLSYTFSNVSC